MVRYGLPVARVLFDLAAVATVGLNVLPFLVGLSRPKAAEQVLAGARRAAAFSALALAVCAVVALVLQTAEVHPDLAAGISPATVVDYVATVSAGKALVFVAAVALVSFVLSMWAVRSGDAVPAELRAAVALFALLPLPVTGHATDWRWQDYAMISMELHVLGAAVWTGGLGAVVIVLATNRTLLAAALPRFSKLATLCLCVVAATGLFNAVGRAGLRPDRDLFANLFGTGYGTLVILKLVCFGRCSPRSAPTSGGGCCLASCATSGPRSSAGPRWSSLSWARRSGSRWCSPERRSADFRLHAFFDSALSSFSAER